MNFTDGLLQQSTLELQYLLDITYNSCTYVKRLECNT